jgi:signal transduction histidine kinase
LADCGIDAQKLVGKDICEAIPFIRSEDAKRHAELVRKVAEQDSAGPIEIAGVGGRWYSITAFRLKDAEGKPTGFFTVCRDITELKRAEEVLREQYTKLKEIDEMKSRFISVATHELRTPLVSIKGYTELIRGGYAGEVPKEIGEMLEIVARNADRLAALTNDLLDQQRLESGRFQISPELFDLREVIKQTIQEVRPQISQKKQTLRVKIPEKPLPVKADRIRIAQVLINLLNNASKFTPERGDISLSLRDVGKFVETRVADTGIGISPDDIQKLFKPFPDIRRPVHYPSTGLGLSICKGIVELHGGRIWAESAGKDMGSTFTFTLPKGEGAGV